ncbi:MAG: hypothetical protein P8J35_03015 [Candidatus Marinimicrobia bacterium]|nr:hypothetical protein [Candidatus Neomarinimicrobiota bacterium]
MRVVSSVVILLTFSLLISFSTVTTAETQWTVQVSYSDSWSGAVDGASVDGTGSETFSISGDVVVASFSKLDGSSNQLCVTLKKGGDIEDRTCTTAAYGGAVVTGSDSTGFDYEGLSTIQIFVFAVIIVGFIAAAQKYSEWLEDEKKTIKAKKKAIKPKNKIISREKSKIKLTKTEKRLTVCQDINCELSAMYGEIYCYHHLSKYNKKEEELRISSTKNRDSILDDSALELLDEGEKSKSIQVLIPAKKIRNTKPPPIKIIEDNPNIKSPSKVRNFCYGCGKKIESDWIICPHCAIRWE